LASPFKADEKPGTGTQTLPINGMFVQISNEVPPKSTGWEEVVPGFPKSPPPPPLAVMTMEP
ncbi:hypothetical protein ANCCEY_15289, partial [Ancylostoma ceylanicum]